MPSVADILAAELLAALKPAVEGAVQRALGGSAPAAASTSSQPSPRTRTAPKKATKAKPGVYIVATSRGRLPDWLKKAAGVDKSTEVTARWPKGTELLKDAPLPPFSAKWQKSLALKATAPKARKVVVKKAVPVAVTAGTEK